MNEHKKSIEEKDLIIKNQQAEINKNIEKINKQQKQIEELNKNKKDVEDIINLSAQVRSINEVVLKKFHIMDLAAQVVTVGIDYGPVTCYCAGTSLDEYYLAGQSIETAKLLSSTTQDCVNISNNIYINLPEDMTSRLFTNQGFVENLKYYYSPLINIRMRKWVAEQG